MANQFASASIYTELIFLHQTMLLWKMHSFAIMLEGIENTVLLTSEKSSFPISSHATARQWWFQFWDTGTLWATILKSQTLEYQPASELISTTSMQNAVKLTLLRSSWQHKSKASVLARIAGTGILLKPSNDHLRLMAFIHHPRLPQSISENFLSEQFWLLTVSLNHWAT